MKKIWKEIELKDIQLEASESLVLYLKRYWKGNIKVEISVGNPVVDNPECSIYEDTKIVITNIQTGEVNTLKFEDKKQ